MTESSRDLQDELTAALVADVGVSEQMAQPFVDSVMRCLRGRKIYVPQAQRVYPTAQIRAELAAGRSVRAVARHFGLSRRQLHRLFPHGLPAAKNG